ncbi:MAG: 2-amino-4-hydroxy-6-hydroxymethyldihydropteridine diphosphokinase [Candidatus Omnitrophica bacterium]|jgi:2-amino-4-hydroxy-6-hydroxymethyldihydropteridine diphosphokinase|nr:2-amino-4-hydroxy-6-hydroxymethyldihydropteridine diphosphokinase [Candidatus Omnitrophota bacterium]
MYVYIGIGSNLEDRLANVNYALQELKSNPDIRIEKISSIIETAPVGGPAQGNYLNGVIKIKTEISAHSLLCVLQNIEKKLGRVRTIKNGPRTIDLDMLLYGDKTINESNLKVPHPKMLERDFVMKPLLEIEPQIMKQIKRINSKPETLNSK